MLLGFDARIRRVFMDYTVEADGRITAGPTRQEVAYVDDQGNIRPNRNGQVIGRVSSTGVVTEGTGYRELGRVSSDGRVFDDRRQEIGRVSAPHIFTKGALMILL
jgi:hypothetical protein